MNVLISGGAKNGKSSFAQNLALEFARQKNQNPMYFATMIPCDGEDRERIRRHREDRKNLGFKTVECGKDISSQLDKINEGDVVLFDSLTALISNELFDNYNLSEEKYTLCGIPDTPDFSNNTQYGIFNTPENSKSEPAESSFAELTENTSSKIIEKVKKELSLLMKKASSVIFVSDGIFLDGKIYGQSTELYRKALAQTENFLAQKCHQVWEMLAGRKIMVKEDGKMDKKNSSKSDKIFDRNRMDKKNPEENVLVIGGAYQGKSGWAKKEFSLNEEDVFSCSRDSQPDFSKKCISHFENYVAFCIKNDEIPQSQFKDKIIIADDIFCGVVPMDAFERRVREEAGKTLQKIAENSRLVRVFCGLPMDLG